MSSSILYTELMVAAFNANLMLFRGAMTPGVSDPGVPVDADHGDDDGGGGWVTIASFLTPFEANLARLKLESAEIDCLLLDENISMSQAFGIITGGVKLKVPALQEQDAREVLSLVAAGHQTEQELDDSASQPARLTPLAAYLVVPALLVISGLLAIRFPAFAVVALMLGVFSLAACSSPYLRKRREHEDQLGD